MSMKAHRFEGLNHDVWLPADITVEIAIVPSNVRNVRSNQRETGQTSFTQHETYNFNAGAGADMHKRWLHSGASGSYVGFNFVVDDKKIIQLTPLNEVTWAAGIPEGNRYSYHSELCVNGGINHTKARRNAAALAGGIFAAKGWSTSNLVQHNHWTGKDCPYLLRREGRWSVFVGQVGNFITEARKGNQGTSPVPSTPISAFNVGDQLKVTENLNVRQGYSTSYKIMTTLPAGTLVKVIKDGSGAHTKKSTKYTWLNIEGAFGSGWAASNWLEKVDAPKKDEGTGDASVKVVNGINFYPVAKGTKYKLSAATNVREWSSIGSKITRTLPSGSIIEPTYEVDGDEVAGEKRWFVLGEPTKPGRIWKGTSKKN